MMTKQIPLIPGAARALLVIAAVCVAPFGLLQADEALEVQKRLDQAVLQEAITPLQAQKRWDAYLRRAAHEEVEASEHIEQEGSEADRHLRRVESELAAAVEGGQLTEAEAEERLAAVRERLGRREHRAQTRQRIERVREAVAAGSMSQEEAERRIRRIEAHANRPEHDDNDHKTLEEFEAEIDRAVAAGTMEPEHAELELQGAREQHAKVSRFEEYKQQLVAQVASGELSESEAREKRLEARKAMFRDGSQ